MRKRVCRRRHQKGFWILKRMQEKWAVNEGGFSGPIRDSHGMLQTEPMEIEHVWEQVYNDLIGSGYEVDMDVNEWIERLGLDMNKRKYGGILNDDLKEDEIVDVIMALKKQKACGCDGIATEVCQMLAEKKSHGRTALISMIKLCWNKKNIPERWK